MGLLKFRHSWLAAMGLAVAIVAQPTLSLSNSGLSLTLGEAALSRSTGGRSGGGSFDAAPSRPSRSDRPSSSSNRRPTSVDDYPGMPYDTPSRPYSRPNTYPRSSYPDYPTVYPPVAVPVPSGYSSGSDDGGLIFFGFVVLIIVSSVVLANRRGNQGVTSANTSEEVGNDRVTLSKVQVALLTDGSTIQADLTQASLAADTSTREGLQSLLQESALALLRRPENWSHALVSSETIARQNAQPLFNQLSIAERAKLSAETLVNVGGKISRKTWQPNPDEGPASYVVVTLLVGSEHDQTLFTQPHSAPDLQAILTQLASLSSEYLLVFEVIWSPQEASDTLTRDEFMEEYADMVQL